MPLKRTKQQDSTPGESASAESGGERTDRGKGNTASWYLNSWPRKSKAPAVTEVARESISAANTALSETISSFAPKPSRSPSIDLIKKGGGSTRSLPADVTTTRINVASTVSLPAPKIPNLLASNTKSNDSGMKDIKSDDQGKAGEPKTGNDRSASDDKQKLGDPIQLAEDGREQKIEMKAEPPHPSQGWLSWLTRHKDGVDAPTEPDVPGNTFSSQPPNTPPISDLQPREDEEPPPKPPITPEQAPTSSTATTTTPQRTSWFYMWPGTSAVPQENEGGKPKTDTQNKEDSTETPQEPETPQPTTESKTSVIENPAQAKDTPKTSGWLFWSRENAVNGGSQEDSQATQSDAPGPASNEPGEAAKPSPAASVSSKPKSKNKKSVKRGSSGAAHGTAAELEPVATPPAGVKSPAPSSKRIQPLPNLLLPAFSNTFPAQERSGILQQLGRYLYYGKNQEPSHVARTQFSPRVNNALSIGIHGYFPAPLIRSVLGQPTGTSVKFATLGEKAILHWAATHSSPCQVKKIALEGEGRIAERLDILWKLLLNWIEDIRKADFILISCHSQGVPVATMLVAKLIAFGCVNSTRIGICAMAGVSLGPFPDFRSRWISGSAGELFDFSDPTSQVSQDYMAALDTILGSGVRITYIGSIDDQLVSLESSVFATVSHPHIYRAVFVDGRVHAPSFVSHLVGFAMKLRNLGISDHGLLRELSSPLAGSLYSGEGHSRLYDDDALYQLAVSFALETTSITNAKLQVHNLRHAAPTANPYILPFAMRGVLEEEYVRRELSEETTELLKQFDEWKPSTKVLKDVKFRLEGIRSKL